MKVGDTIKIVQSRPPTNQGLCGQTNWFIPSEIASIYSKIDNSGWHQYFYRDYEDVVGIVVKVYVSSVYYKHDLNYPIVLIGNKKIVCYKEVLEKVGD